MITGRGIHVAVRGLLRRPSYAVVSVFTLAAAVTAAVIFYSVYEGVVLRPLPYPESGRLFRVYGTDAQTRTAENEAARSSWDRLPVTRDMLSAWNRQVDGLTVGGWVAMPVSWEDQIGVDEIEGAWTLEGFFETMGVEPLIGRLPTAEENEAGAEVVVISEELWASRYGRDPGVLGRTVRHAWAGRSVTIVGVLPRAFAIPSGGTHWWGPVHPVFADGRRNVRQISAVARLEDGLSAEEAGERLDASTAGLADANPAYEGQGARLVSLHEAVVGNVRPALKGLLWAVALVMLIASANLANLVVARTSGRKGELAIRAALGGGRGAVVGVILGEVVLICAAAGAVALLAASLALDPLVEQLTATVPGLPRVENARVNLSVMGFAGGLAAATALLAGLVPALVWCRRPPWKAMHGAVGRTAGRGTRRSQRGLIVTESTLAVVLLVTAGLLLRSVWESHSVDPGFEAQGVVYLQVGLVGAREAADLVEIGEQLDGRLAALPSVTSVGRTRSLPAMSVLGGLRRNLVWLPDRTFEDGVMTTTMDVGPGYFRTLGIPLVAGRSFRDSDGPDGEAVAVVSERFVQDFLGGGDPVGRMVRFGTMTRVEGGRFVAEEGRLVRIVGVVGDVRQMSLTTPSRPVLYQSLAQIPSRSQGVVVRTSGEAREALPAIREVMEEVGEVVEVRDMGLLRTVLWQPLAPLRVVTGLAVALAGLAGLLTLAGIYGVVAHVVSESVREIGVRMALGAAEGGEVARVVGQVLWPVLTGAALGVGASMVASPVAEGRLFGVSTVDPLTYGSVPVLVLVMAAVAAWVPARRAARVDPMRTLDRD